MNSVLEERSLSLKDEVDRMKEVVRKAEEERRMVGVLLEGEKRQWEEREKEGEAREEALRKEAEAQVLSLTARLQVGWLVGWVR